MQLENLYQDLPTPIKEVIAFLNAKKYKVGLIGGVSRDYLLNGSITHDIDCELRHISGKDSQKNWDDLFRELKNIYQIKKTSFEILQITLTDGYELDLSRPRLEIFTNENHHKNFEAKFIADPDYSSAFKRRDFTINAIMLEIFEKSICVIDPLNGIEHLQQKQLVACGKDFDRDPVRLLRALRFKCSFDLVFSPQIKKILSSINKIYASSHYFSTEFIKSKNPFKMLVEYAAIDKRFTSILDYQVEIAQFYKAFNEHNIVNLCQAVALSPLTATVKNELCQLFGLSKSKVCFIEMKKIVPEIIGHDYKDENFIEFVDWLTCFFEKVPSSVTCLLLKRAGVTRFTAKELDRLQDIQIANELLQSISPKLRKYYIWHCKFQKLLNI